MNLKKLLPTSEDFYKEPYVLILLTFTLLISVMIMMSMFFPEPTKTVAAAWALISFGIIFLAPRVGGVKSWKNLAVTWWDISGAKSLLKASKSAFIGIAIIQIVIFVGIIYLAIIFGTPLMLEFSQYISFEILPSFLSTAPTPEGDNVLILGGYMITMTCIAALAALLMLIWHKYEKWSIKKFAEIRDKQQD